MEKISLEISSEETRTQSIDFTNVTNYDLRVQSLSSNLIKPKYRRSNSTKANKVKNFQKHYLDLGLWPDNISSDIRKKYYSYKKKIELLKNKANKDFDDDKENKEKECVNCEKIINMYKANKLALNQALELSSILIKEIASIENWC